MKKTRMPQRLLSLVLVLMMLISVLPVSAMAAELTPSDPETGLTATDVTNELTDSDRLAIFEENMDSGKVSRSEIPADDEMVKVIVQLDADSLLDVRNRTNASMSMLDFQQTDAAKAQLKDIANLQLSVMNTMESKGIPSSFTFSYTSVVSGFAAQVPYGKIHDIKNISGVEDVVLCQTYYTDSMGSATLGQALTAAEVAAYSNNTQYQGEEDHPVIFAQLTKRDGSFLVGREPGPFSWEDVRGRTIIGGRAGGVPEMTLEYVLRQRGIEPQRDAVVDTSVQFNMMAGAFTGGNGDYVTLFEPTATEVEQAGKGYILCSIGQESGEIPYTAYFANRSYVEANPETVQGFVNAMALAQQWVAEHTDRQVAEAICDQFPDTDLDVLERVCARHREIDAWNRTPVMEQQALERLETVMTQAGELTPDQWVDFDGLVDNRFAQKAAGQ